MSIFEKTITFPAFERWLSAWRCKSDLSLLFPYVKWKQTEVAIFLSRSGRGPSSDGAWIERGKDGRLKSFRETPDHRLTRPEAQSIQEHELEAFLKGIKNLQFGQEALPMKINPCREGCIVLWTRQAPATLRLITGDKPEFEASWQAFSKAAKELVGIREH